MRAISKKQARRNREKEPVRIAVFARDGYRCLLSDVSVAGACFGHLTPHHLLKESQGGEYVEENLVSLCSSHNDRIESDADLASLAHRLGLVVRRGETLAEAWERMDAAGLLAEPFGGAA